MKEIVSLIAAAQAASDSGKWNRLSEQEKLNSNKLCDLLPHVMAQKASYQGYRYKDLCIYNAIEKIRRSNEKIFFFVSPDKEKIAKYIVYFDIKTSNKRYQVSFHSFDKRLERYINYRFSSHWDEKSSRKACIELMQSL